MRPFIILYLLLMNVSAYAQMFTYTNYAIKLDQGQPHSVFPIFQSASRPKVAAAISQALQMNCFDKIQTARNPGAIKDSDVDDDGPQWTYKVDLSNDRMIRVTTMQWIPAGGMHTPEHTVTIDHFFDTQTGDLFFSQDFLTVQGIAQAKEVFKKNVEINARKQYEIMKKKYPADLLKKYLPDINGCIAEIKGYVDKSNYQPTTFDVFARQMTFVSSWCSGTSGDGDDGNDDVPELNEPFSMTLSKAELDPYMSAYWTFYILNQGPAPVPDPIVHTWKGTIGDKIPVTFRIGFNPRTNSWYGAEVYDNFGIVIRLVCSKSGNSYLLNEIDGSNVKVGYFEVTPTADGQLTGVWKKGDGSKTMTYKGQVAGK